MPLPLAHTIVGYSVAAASGVRFRRDTRTALMFSLVVANMPDVDFLPGALRNDPVLYHRTIAHTVPAAIVCSLIVAAIVTRFRGRFAEVAVLTFMVYCSHLVADMVEIGVNGGGVQLLWPFSSSWFTIPTPFSMHFRSLLVFERGQTSSGFFHSFTGWPFLRALLLQALVFAPLLLPAWWIRSSSSARRPIREPSPETS